MSVPTYTTTGIVAGQPQNAAEVKTALDEIKTILNGNLDNSNVVAGAGVLYSKLALADSVKATDMAKDANGLAAGAFRATAGGSQSITNGGTNVKLQFPTEAFDISDWYDNATNYRFTPLVKGIYQFEAAWYSGAWASGANQNLQLYKNGSLYAVLARDGMPAAVTCISGSCIANANGTTDYFEIYVSHSDTGANTADARSYFSGHLIGRQS